MLTQHDINKGNDYQIGNKYKDEKAAMEKRGSPFKKPLTVANNPFVYYFNYGAQ
jgi:hypothetical protein